VLSPRRKLISADRHFTAKKSTAWPIPGRGVPNIAPTVEIEAFPGFYVLRVKALGTETRGRGPQAVTISEWIAAIGVRVYDPTHRRQFKARCFSAEFRRGLQTLSYASMCHASTGGNATLTDETTADLYVVIAARRAERGIVREGRALQPAWLIGEE
jgi:hypothetical protein